MLEQVLRLEEMGLSIQMGKYKTMYFRIVLPEKRLSTTAKGEAQAELTLLLPPFSFGSLLFSFELAFHGFYANRV